MNHRGAKGTEAAPTWTRRVGAKVNSRVGRASARRSRPYRRNGVLKHALRKAFSGTVRYSHATPAPALRAAHHLLRSDLDSPLARAEPPRELWLYYPTNLSVTGNVTSSKRVWGRAAKAGYTHVLLADSKMAKLNDLGGWKGSTARTPSG